MIDQETPMFSVIIPTRNRSALLRRCAGSLLNQRFKNFELIFRRNFLKIVLIQEDLEDGDSCFTLRDTIDSSEFEVPKTQDEAIDYLWNFLVNNSFIKPTRVNIGLISSKDIEEKQKEIKEESILIRLKNLLFPETSYRNLRRSIK